MMSTRSSSIVVEEVTPVAYGQRLEYYLTDCFLTPLFNELNRHKTDEIKYLLFSRDGKPVGGIICGLKDGLLRSPFSAPYGGFVMSGSNSFETYVELARCFAEYCHENGCSCRLTFPASVVQDKLVNDSVLMMSALRGVGFKEQQTDVNFHFELNGEGKEDRNTRRQAKASRRQGTEFVVSKFSEVMLRDIYAIVELNHKELGYTVSMGYDDFVAMDSVTPIYLFGTKKDMSLNSGAICYKTRPGILQVIMWGDLPEGRSEVSPMAFLATELINWMRENVKDIVAIDLGPSSNDGHPSAGLSTFKLKLGAVPTLKTTLFFNNDQR